MNNPCYLFRRGKAMHKKFGTVLDNKLLSRVRVYCHKKHTTISRFLEEALYEYLQKQEHAGPPFSTVESSFGALRISAQDLRSVLEEDLYEI